MRKQIGATSGTGTGNGVFTDGRMQLRFRRNYRSSTTEAVREEESREEG